MQAGLYLVVVTADRKVDMKVLAGKLVERLAPAFLTL